MTIEKLRQQYQTQVGHLDTAIEKLTAAIQQARKDNNEGDMEEYRQERAGCQTKRQIYFQITKDLEDLTTN